MFSLAHNFAKSLISSGSALLSFKSLAIFLKCFLVIIYQRVCLYKGFSTPVEKLAPGWAQHGRAGDASLRLTLGRSLSARPFAIPCQASPIVLDAGQFIRLGSYNCPFRWGYLLLRPPSYVVRGLTEYNLFWVRCNTILLFSSSSPVRGVYMFILVFLLRMIR